MVITARLLVMWGRADIAPWQVCSHCSSTRCLLAADLLSSWAGVLTGLAPERGSPAPDTSQETLFSRHLCWLMGLRRVMQISQTLMSQWWLLVAAEWCPSSHLLQVLAQVHDGALLRSCCWYRKVWGSNNFLAGELNWFNAGTKSKSSATWKPHSCQSTFSSKIEVSLVLLGKKERFIMKPRCCLHKNTFSNIFVLLWLIVYFFFIWGTDISKSLGQLWIMHHKHIDPWVCFMVHNRYHRDMSLCKGSWCLVWAAASSAGFWGLSASTVMSVINNVSPCTLERYQNL